MSDTIETVLHSYCIYTNTPEGKAEYAELRERLAGHPHPMVSWGGSSHYLSGLDGRTVQLETRHLFDNQWNTAPIEGASDKGLRVFDWAEDARVGDFPKHIRRGHYLDQTPAMRELRRNTHKCGYCGKQEPAAKGYVFCPHCLDSEYLTEKDLPLTRMVPVCDGHKDSKPLTKAESEHLLPLFRAAKIHGTTERGIARLAAERIKVNAHHDKVVKNAKTERDGLLWLMDRGMRTDNVLFYSHTGRFGFGWRQPVDAAVLSELMNAICEFPFAYDIKTADGRTLSGN